MQFGVAAAAAALETPKKNGNYRPEKLKAYSRSQAIITPQGGFVDYFLNTSVTTKIPKMPKIGDCEGGLQTNPAYDINTGGPLGSTADSSSDTQVRKLPKLLPIKIIISLSLKKLWALPPPMPLTVLAATYTWTILLVPPDIHTIQQTIPRRFPFALFRFCLVASH